VESVSDVEFYEWWHSPVGREFQQELKNQIVVLNDSALSEPAVRDPIKGAIYLGKKQAFQEILERGEKYES